MAKNEITIEATYILETPKSYFLDCEGDKRFFPKSQVTFNHEKQELTAPKWLLEEKFPGEKF